MLLRRLTEQQPPYRDFRSIALFSSNDPPFFPPCRIPAARSSEDLLVRGLSYSRVEIIEHAGPREILLVVVVANSITLTKNGGKHEANVRKMEEERERRKGRVAFLFNAGRHILNRKIVGFAGRPSKERSDVGEKRRRKKEKTGVRSTGPFFSHILGWSHLRLLSPPYHPLPSRNAAWITAIKPTPLIETIVINYRI